MEIDEKHTQCSPGQLGSSATNMAIVEESVAGDDVLALYRDFRFRFGRVDLPGIVKCFATNPPLLKCMIDLAAGFLFVDSHLTRKHKEMVATLVSAQNECPYCASSHGNLLLAHGGTTEILSSLESGVVDSACFTKREQALLGFVLRVNAASQFINRPDVEETMQAGWTEAQLAEAVHLTALFAAFNRIANAFGIVPPNLRLA